MNCLHQIVLSAMGGCECGACLPQIIHGNLAIRYTRDGGYQILISGKNTIDPEGDIQPRMDELAKFYKEAAVNVEGMGLLSRVGIITIILEYEKPCN